MTRSLVSLSRTAVVSIGFTVFVSSMAAAQTPAAPAGSITSPSSASAPWFASAIRGKTVWITADGVRLRGLVTSVSATGLVLVEDGSPTTIPYSQIVRVEKSTHRLRTGTLIGLASGAGFALTLLAAACDGDCYGGAYVALPLFYGGLGAAAGVGIGAIVNNAKKGGGDVIYDARRRTTTMTLAPILSPTRKGMAFSMTWR